MPSSENPFRPALFTFLKELKANNDRDWFQANKSRYEDHVKEPALRFISDFGPRLAKISPHFNAVPKATGGSLFRIYRDTRFSKDKSPYKTAVGIQFRHKAFGGDVHTPGYYLHLEPGSCFMGAGIWHPDAGSLRKIRATIVADPTAWKRARDAKRFRETFALEGESLKTAPRGFDPDHPLIQDLRRKDFIGGTQLTRKAVLATDFLQVFTRTCRAATPFMRFLCRAVEVEF